MCLWSTFCVTEKGLCELQMNLSTQLTLPGVHKKYTMGFRCWQCSCRFVDMLCTLRRSLLTQNEQKKLDMQQSCTVRHLNIKILQRKKKTFTILIFSFLVGAIVFLEKLTSLVSHEFKRRRMRQAAVLLRYTIKP